MSGKQPQRANLDYERQRRYRRFDLQFPVLVSFPAENAVEELNAITRNVSLGGLLLEVNRPLPVGTHVDLRIAVETADAGHPIHLLGEGDIVRVYTMDSGAGFALAVECQRPIAEVRNSLRVAG